MQKSKIITIELRTMTVFGSHRQRDPPPRQSFTVVKTGILDEDAEHDPCNRRSAPRRAVSRHPRARPKTAVVKLRLAAHDDFFEFNGIHGN
jgi:hypothetical protein